MPNQGNLQNLIQTEKNASPAKDVVLAKKENQRLNKDDVPSWTETKWERRPWNP